LFSNYDVSENPNSAILFLKNAIWKNPNCISAYYKLGYIFEKNLNKIDASIYYYKKAVLLNPNDDKCEGNRQMQDIYKWLVNNLRVLCSQKKIIRL
jgi:tetratricopeptide (TPR) repeat protein